jgi:hypothetical protein
VDSGLAGKSSTSHNHSGVYSLTSHTHSTYMLKTGGTFTGQINCTSISMTGNLNHNSNRATNMASPTQGTDGANRTYVLAQVSDVRLKENMTPLSSALDSLMEIETFTFNFIDPQTAQRDYHYTKYGLSAQNVEAHFPDAVHHASFDRAEDGSSISGENYLGVDYAELVPVLIKAIQELTAKVEALES